MINAYVARIIGRISQLTLLCVLIAVKAVGHAPTQMSAVVSPLGIGSAVGAIANVPRVFMSNSLVLGIPCVSAVLMVAVLVPTEPLVQHAVYWVGLKTGVLNVSVRLDFG